MSCCLAHVRLIATVRFPPLRIVLLAEHVLEKIRRLGVHPAGPESPASIFLCFLLLASVYAFTFRLFFSYLLTHNLINQKRRTLSQRKVAIDLWSNRLIDRSIMAVPDVLQRDDLLISSPHFDFSKHTLLSMRRCLYMYVSTYLFSARCRKFILRF